MFSSRHVMAWVLQHKGVCMQQKNEEQNASVCFTVEESKMDCFVVGGDESFSVLSTDND